MRAVRPLAKDHVAGRVGVVTSTDAVDERYGPYMTVLLDGDSLDSRFYIEESLELVARGPFGVKADGHADGAPKQGS